MEDILKNAKTIAVVGASTTRTRASNRIVRYLVEAGFDVIPINPHYDLVEGLQSYRSITDIPAGVKVDIFNIFRNARFTLGVVQEVIDWAKATNSSPAIWTQLGVSTFDAQQLAEEANLEYVANRCIMVVHSTMQPDGTL